MQLRPLARIEMHQRLGAATDALTCRRRPIDLRLDRCICMQMTAVFLTMPLKEQRRTDRANDRRSVVRTTDSFLAIPDSVASRVNPSR